MKETSMVGGPQGAQHMHWTEAQQDDDDDKDREAKSTDDIPAIPELRLSSRKKSRSYKRQRPTVRATG